MSDGQYKGVAPEANLVGVKVLDSAGSGSTSDVIAGIQWAVQNKDTYNIRVVNLSLGAPDDEGTADNLDDVIAEFSSRGPTIDGLAKPDLVAPGVIYQAPSF